MKEVDQAFVADFQAQAFGIETAYENADFEPTRGVPWVALKTLENRVTPGDVGAVSRETSGLFQFALNYPLGEGAIPAKSQADTIFAAYPPGRRVSYGTTAFRVTATETFDAAPQGGWFRVVGRIFYELENG